MDIPFRLLYEILPLASRQLINILNGKALIFAGRRAINKYMSVNPDIMTFFKKRGYNADFNSAIINGDLECVKMLKRGFPDHAICLAVEHGHLAIVKYFHENGCKLFASMFCDAIKYHDAGHHNYEMIDWLYENDCPYTDNVLCDAAHDINVFNYVRHKCKIDMKDMDLRDLYKRTAGYGNIELLQLIYKKTGITTVGCYDTAIQKGKLNSIVWLYCNNFPIAIPALFVTASTYGHDHIILWALFKHNYSRDRLLIMPCKISSLILQSYFDTIDEIQYIANVEIAEWMKKRGIAFTEEHFEDACQDGNLELMEFIYGECNIGENMLLNCMIDAIRNENFSVVELLYDSIPDLKLQIEIFNLTDAHAEIIKWLHVRNACVCINFVICGVIVNNNVEFLEWLVGRGYVVDSSMYIYCGEIDVMRYMHDILKLPLDANDLYIPALRNGNIDILDWLYNNGYRIAKNNVLRDMNNASIKWLETHGI
jgi:hypothetical protein